MKTCTKNASYSCYCAFFLLVFSCMPPKQLASGSLLYHYYYRPTRDKHFCRQNFTIIYTQNHQIAQFFKKISRNY